MGFGLFICILVCVGFGLFVFCFVFCVLHESPYFVFF